MQFFRISLPFSQKKRIFAANFMRKKTSCITHRKQTKNLVI